MFIYLRFPKILHNGYKTVVLKGDQPSFTFFNTLFIAENELADENGEVLLHEMAHCREWHSIDIIILELITVIQWFNPMVWLYRTSLKSQHEYAADNYVLENGHNVISYQQILFERAVGFSYPGLINHFNHSLIKNRLIMLTQNKSKTYHRILYFISIPLMLITAMLFLNQPNVQAQKTDEAIYDQADQMPEYPGGIEAVRKYIAENITYPKEAQDAGISAKIFVSFVVDEKGKVANTKVERTDLVERIKDSATGEIVVVGYESKEKTEANPDAIIALETEAVRVIQSLGNWKPGMTDGKYVKVQYTFPIQFILQ
jgi:hypothetical protein